MTDNQKPQHINTDPRNPIEIKKTGWTPERRKEWFSNLETKETPRRTAQDRFEIENTGPLNYRIVAGDQKFWADGIEDLSVVEAKMVVTPSKSPYIPGTNNPGSHQREHARRGSERVRAYQ